MLDDHEVYNACLLFSPERRMWRYDKNYPWGWERATFRGGQSTTIANTCLGPIGMMTCWDVAHPRLWREYYERISLVIVCSCPPDITHPTYTFPSGAIINADRMGPIMAAIKEGGHNTFDKMVAEQAAWMKVPIVMSSTCGTVETHVPASRASLACLLPTAPWLGRYWSQARQMRLVSQILPAGKIINNMGEVLTRLDPSQNESLVIAEVELGKPGLHPGKHQPPTIVSPMAYFLSDFLLPLISLRSYRQGIKRVLIR
jgi:predicted amidohydrolase